MKPSIFTSFDYDIPFDRAVSMIKEAGFESVGLGPGSHSGYGTPEGRKKIKKLLAGNNLSIDSVHAPFPGGDELFSPDESRRLESVRQCMSAVDASEFLQGKAVALHLMPLSYYIVPGSYPDFVLKTYRDPGVERRMISQGMKSISALAGYAGERGVMLGLENGQVPDYDMVLEMLLDEFQGSVVGFCYDSGHENVQGGCFTMLQKHAGRLNSLHIHDNFGTDAHMLPYEGNINWDKFRSILNGLDYAGDLCMEVHPRYSEFNDPGIFLAEAGKRAERML